MKEQYTSPDMEIIDVELVDILTVSGEDDFELPIIPGTTEPELPVIPGSF